MDLQSQKQSAIVYYTNGETIYSDLSFMGELFLKTDKTYKDKIFAFRTDHRVPLYENYFLDDELIFTFLFEEFNREDNISYCSVKCMYNHKHDSELEHIIEREHKGAQ